MPKDYSVEKILLLLNKVHFKCVQSIGNYSHEDCTVLVKFDTDNTYYNDIYGLKIMFDETYVEVTLIDKKHSGVLFNNKLFGYLWTKNSVVYDCIFEDHVMGTIKIVSLMSRFFKYSKMPLNINSHDCYSHFKYFKNHMKKCLNHETECANNKYYSTFGGSICGKCKRNAIYEITPQCYKDMTHHRGNYWELYEKYTGFTGVLVNKFANASCAISWITINGDITKTYLIKKYNFGFPVKRKLCLDHTLTTCFEKIVFNKDKWTSSHIRTNDEIWEV
jgi:hypothetical protein